MNNYLNLFLYHLIESTIWCLLFILIARLFSERESSIRCWIYRIALLKFVFPSVLLVNFLHLSPTEELVPIMTVVVSPLDGMSYAEPTTASIPYLLYAWIAGILVLSGRGIITLTRFSHNLHQEQNPFAGRCSQVLSDTLKTAHRSAQHLQGYFVKSGPSIGLYGIFRPRIIAKPEFLEILNDKELIAAFQHELAHRQRQDNLWSIIYGGITSIFWFHPIVWYLKKRILIETEKACDEMVITAGQASNTYAHCLLKAAEYTHNKSYFYSVALSETSIKTRVSNIIQYQKRNRNHMKIIAIVIAAITLISGSFTLLASTEGPVKRFIADKDFYAIDELDVAPEATHREEPRYPYHLRKENIKGEVTLNFIIDPEGNVRNISVTSDQASNPDFIAPSVEALMRWKFTPGRVEGRQVNVASSITLKYTTNPDKDHAIIGLEKLASLDDKKSQLLYRKFIQKLERSKQLEKEQQQKVRLEVQAAILEHLKKMDERSEREEEATRL